ncbi:FAD-binding protein [Desulfobacula sp.]|uniref:FAD-binding protein n=1 Tax=Desulfobacula sp. TaxID=2593537 RepID=UPI0026270717|nr:FAD-binding protein [Desulfobacula sp.]
MSTFFESFSQHGESSLKWPYPIKYGEETELTTDVLVLGGGPAGCMAAISAAKRGLSVIVADKSHSKRAGGGSGVDHWVNCPNPASPVTAEEAIEWEVNSYGGYANALSRYIAARESYDTLLEIEEMGGKIRDLNDEFKGAPFRDEKTKFLYAYDYKNNITIRIWGTTFKPAMYKRCKKLGVKMLNRLLVTSLLTEDGRQGERVVGATGLNTRTGEFFIMKAKAVINCMSFAEGNWLFSSELTGLPYFHPNIICDGPAIAWNAGAEFTMMEKSSPAPAPGYQLPSYGSGNPKNTWYPATMVDAQGKIIPWVDGKGNPINDVSERTLPAEGQKYFGDRSLHPDHRYSHLVDDLETRIRNGEYMLPLYADLTDMPDHERRVIWGMMVGEEGRTKVPVYDTYTAAGFDPKKDLLQSYYMLGGEPFPGMWQHETVPYFRGRGPFASPGGLVTDWNLQTNLEGLFAAGNALYAGNYYSHAAATGRYAGRKAAEYALTSSDSVIDRDQVTAEKNRVLAPAQLKSGMDWKELRAGLCRVMQQYCGEIKNENLLNLGLIWLKDIRENILPNVYAHNPHMLGRVIESFNLLDGNELIINSCLARRASSKHLGFTRQEYQEMDPPDWHAFVTTSQKNGQITSDKLSLDYSNPISLNYERHNSDYKGYLSH